MLHGIVNANSIVQHAIQIKNEITKHVKVNTKLIIRVKNIIAGILSHVFLTIVCISNVLLILQ